VLPNRQRLDLQQEIRFLAINFDNTSHELFAFKVLHVPSYACAFIYFVMIMLYFSAKLYCQVYVTWVLTPLQPASAKDLKQTLGECGSCSVFFKFRYLSNSDSAINRRYNRIRLTPLTNSLYLWEILSLFSVKNVFLVFPICCHDGRDQLQSCRLGSPILTDTWRL